MLNGLLLKCARCRLCSALADMNEALRLDPKEVSYYFNRARIKYHQDDLQGAMADYDYILKLDPDNTMTYYNRGLLRMQVGERNKAISDFTKVIKAEPDNYFAIYNRALLYDMIGNYGKAISDFNVVLEQYPDFAAVFMLAPRRNGKWVYERRMKRISCWHMVCKRRPSMNRSMKIQ